MQRNQFNQLVILVIAITLFLNVLMVAALTSHYSNTYDYKGTTFMGGTVALPAIVSNLPALLASFNTIADVVYDNSTGYYYVADSGAFVIRKVSAQTLIISDFAGKMNVPGTAIDVPALGNSCFSSIKGMLLHPITGDLYVADMDATRIVVINKQTGIVSLGLGGGNVQPPVLPGPFTSTKVFPLSIAFDPTGKFIYIGDLFYNSIWKGDFTSKTITKIAGTTTGGTGADNLLATSTALLYPAVAVNSIGELYVIDTENNCIRKLLPNNKLQVIVGNCTTTTGVSPLKYPTSIRFLPGSTSDFYIYDSLNHKVKIYYSATSSLVDFAGTGKYTKNSAVQNKANPLSVSIAPYAPPNVNPPFYSGLFVDNNGDLLIPTKNAVLKVNTTENTISTIIGNGMPAGYFYLNNDQKNYVMLNDVYDVYYNSATSSVYVIDQGMNMIWKINSGIASLVAGMNVFNDNYGDGKIEDISLASPRVMTMDSSGAIYFIEYVSHSNTKVRKLATDGSLTTIASGKLYNGEGIPALQSILNQPSQILMHSSGELYIVDRGNYCIRKIDSSGNIVTVAGTPGVQGIGGYGGLATNALLNDPISIAFYSATVMAISDTIGKFSLVDLTTNIITDITPTLSNAGLDPPQSSFFKGNILYAYTGGVYFIMVDIFNNGYRNTLDASKSLDAYAVDGRSATTDGTIIYAVGRNPASDISTVIMNGQSTWSGWSTVAGGGSDIAFTTSTTSTLATSVKLTTIAIDYSIPNSALVIAEKEKSVILEVKNSKIYLIAGTYGVSGFTEDGKTATNTKISNLVSAFKDASGNYYYLENTLGLSRIRKISSGTNLVTTIAGSQGDGLSALNANIGCPNGIAVATDGTVYITTTNPPALRKIATNGIISYLGGYASSIADAALATASYFGNPKGISFDAAQQNLYIAMSSQHVVRKYSLSDGRITTVAGVMDSSGDVYSTSKLDTPWGVKMNSRGDLYISEAGAYSNILKVPSGGSLKPLTKNNRTPNDIYAYTDGQNPTFKNIQGIAIVEHTPSTSVQDEIYVVDNGDKTVRNLYWGKTCSYGWLGEFCNITTCNNINSNDPTVCSGYGECTSLDNCNCDPNYPGNYCDEYECYGQKANDVSNVCSGQGKCVDTDTCSCLDGYGDIYCHTYICGGILASNTSYVCGGHGFCYDAFKCSCNIGYTGPLCGTFNCYGVSNSDPTVCSGHGACKSIDKCTCNSGYSGSTCSSYTCFGIMSNVSTVCSAHGSCISADTCTCESGWKGSNNCSQFSCDGVNYCSGNGQCVSNNTCSCTADFSGSDCSIPNPSCFGFTSTNPLVCSSHGKCISADVCQCDNGYSGVNCSVPSCFGILANESTVCSSNGICTFANVCQCISGWQGNNDCSQISCDGRNYCSHNGQCISNNTCTCDIGWNGSNCSLFNCDLLNGCSNKGQCILNNTCQCDSGWQGNSNCTQFTCDGKNNCSGKGQCTSNNTCQCESGWLDNNDCSQFTCDAVNSCSNKGQCISNNTCQCISGWQGNNDCSQFTCDGTNDCNEKGECVGNNTCQCDSGWQGNGNCSQFTCDGISDCNGQGQCISNNTCQCSSGWQGNFDCSQFTCDGKTNCNGKGQCVGNNTCSCESGWKDNNDCSQFTCDSLNNCSSHGLCVSNNTCSCDSGWKGSNDCSQFTCDGQNYCNNQGSCIGNNTCACQSGWQGNSDCSQFTCDGLNNCSRHGHCTSNNTCSCDGGYYGNDCSICSCFGILGNNSNVCSSHGRCTDVDLCVCQSGWLDNYNCSQFTCDGMSNCNGKGQCIGNNTCQCESGWRGSNNCSVISCDALNNCNNQGSCVSNNTCSCDSGWKGNNNCSQFTCDGQNYCNNQGNCIGNNTCACQSGWLGSSDCSKFTCEALNDCSGNGQCISNNTCSCESGWLDNNDCSQFTCDAVNSCSNKGHCISNNTCQCESGWQGNSNCTQFTCDGMNYCNGKGQCVLNNTCSCESGWKDNNDCSQFTCDALNSCSNDGQCISNNTCQCISGWQGNSDCSQFTCDGMSNCNGKGQCIGNNTCQCASGWMDNNDCSQFTCDAVNSCSNKGQCISNNTCQCISGWQGNSNCTQFTCDGKSNCNGKGQCIGNNTCQCESGWMDSNDCSQFTCDSLNNCRSRGHCISNNTCSCDSGYFGNDCSIISCYGIAQNNQSVCFSNGNCTSMDQCSCYQTWYGAICDITSCYGILGNESNACSSHGNCSSFDSCECYNGYSGLDCSIPSCFGVQANDTTVCSSHGNCIDKNICSCSSTNYTGQNCEIPTCFNISAASSQVCSSHGSCVGVNNCSCTAEYIGDSCSTPISCDGIIYSSPSVCHTHGSCIAMETCSCYGNFTGKYCENCTVGIYGEVCSTSFAGPVLFNDESTGILLNIYAPSNYTSKYVDCNRLLTSLEGFGVGPKCYWLDRWSGLFLIQFGDDPTIVTPTVLQLNTKVFDRDPGNEVYVQFQVSPPQNPVPTVTIIQKTQTLFGSCENILLSGINSYAKSGRDITMYQWEYISGPLNISNLLTKTVFVSLPYLQIPSGDYTVKLTTSDVFGGSSFDTFSFTKSQFALPIVDIVGSRAQSTLMSNVPYFIKKIVTLPECIPADTTVTYTWKQVSGPSLVYSVDSQNNVVISSFPTDNEHKFEFSLQVAMLASQLTTNVSVNTMFDPLSCDIYIEEQNHTFVSISSELFDPDNSNIQTSFVWSCIDVTNTISTACDASITSVLNLASSSMVSFNTITNSIQSLQITLSVTKGSRYVNSSIIVNVVPTTTPLPPIISTLNILPINQKVNPGDLISVQTDVVPKECELTWYMNSSPLSVFSNLTSLMTSLNTPNLVLPSLILTPGQLYTFTLKAALISDPSITTTKSYTFSINNERPQCSCSFTPSEGIAIITDFTYYCKCKNGPLQYSFGFVDDNTGVKLPLFLSGNTFSSKLPSPAFGNILQVYADVTNTDTGAVFSTYSNINISIPSVSSPDQVNSLVVSWTNIQKALAKTDLMTNVYNSAIITRVKNSMNAYLAIPILHTCSGRGTFVSEFNGCNCDGGYFKLYCSMDKHQYEIAMNSTIEMANNLANSYYSRNSLEPISRSEYLLFSFGVSTLLESYDELDLKTVVSLIDVILDLHRLVEISPKLLTSDLETNYLVNTFVSLTWFAKYNVAAKPQVVKMLTHVNLLPELLIRTRVVGMKPVQLISPFFNITSELNWKKNYGGSQIEFLSLSTHLPPEITQSIEQKSRSTPIQYSLNIISSSLYEPIINSSLLTSEPDRTTFEANFTRLMSNVIQFSFISTTTASILSVPISFDIPLIETVQDEKITITSNVTKQEGNNFSNELVSEFKYYGCYYYELNGDWIQDESCILTSIGLRNATCSCYKLAKSITVIETRSRQVVTTSWRVQPQSPPQVLSDDGGCKLCWLLVLLVPVFIGLCCIMLAVVICCKRRRKKEPEPEEQDQEAVIELRNTLV